MITITKEEMGRLFDKLIDWAEYEDSWVDGVAYVDGRHILIDREDGEYTIYANCDVVRTTTFSGGDGYFTPKEYIDEYRIKNLELQVCDPSGEELIEGGRI